MSGSPMRPGELHTLKHNLHRYMQRYYRDQVSYTRAHMIPIGNTQIPIVRIRMHVISRKTSPITYAIHTHPAPHSCTPTTRPTRAMACV